MFIFCCCCYVVVYLRKEIKILEIELEVSYQLCSFPGRFSVRVKLAVCTMRFIGILCIIQKP